MEQAERSTLHWVLIHGAGGSGDLWDLVRPHFPGAWIVDLPGHEAGRARRPGGTPPQPGPLLRSIDAYADWISAGIAEQGWADVVVVGHSMGGAIAQTLGLRRPAWLRGLVLSSTAARLPVSATLLHLVATDYPAAVDWVIAHAFAAPPSAYRRAGIRRQMLRVPPAVTLADYEACAGFDITAQVQAGALPGPAVIISGSGDRMVPPAGSLFLASHISPARQESIPGAGHMAPLEQPEVWAAQVQALWVAVSTAS
ncbi:MAG TPA: alpha/beta fold hydrolase [Chloroflexia bacterium]|nr:alpha/beta fold hydrolase [Chloroflexia bacterium]